MSALITGQFLNEPKTKIVKYITQSVFFNHWSINTKIQNKVIKLANIECLLLLLVNYQINLK